MFMGEPVELPGQKCCRRCGTIAPATVEDELMTGGGTPMAEWTSPVRDGNR